MAPTAARVDWFRVIVDLERSGLSQEEIGRRVGRSQPQINAYKTIPDTEPRYHVGAQLLALWRQRTRRKAWPTVQSIGKPVQPRRNTAAT